MFIKFHSVLNTIVVEGRFKYKGLTLYITSRSAKTRDEALNNFFTAYEDAMKDLNTKEVEVMRVINIPKRITVALPVKSERYKMPFSFMYEKKDYSRNLRFVRRVAEEMVSPYTQCLFN